MPGSLRPQVATFWCRRLREVGTEDEAAVILEGVRAVQGLEIRARDRAGNETVLPLTGPSREVRIVKCPQ